ncbi:signal-regulatory protein beta-2 [Elgaria multicarinata webbii]|uniref:signal-regulatory protein beta-2 n=1 Tax=Elgaria multicarinata webbii TaxID=159646 RepID=UPI002FCD218E
MAASSPFSGWPRLFRLLLLLLLLVGAKGQKVEVLQSPESLSVSLGQTVTLTCKLKGTDPPGGVRWHKGSDRQQRPVYSQNESFPPRVSRVSPESDADFTISIRDMQPEDAGMYYCVKYRARATGETEEASGKGTVVSVVGVKVVQPQDASVTAGGTLRLKCTVTGGGRPGPVKWFLGEGPSRKLIYADVGKFERVMREYQGSSTDFTILIRNVSLEDTGTYYCVKQKLRHNDDTDEECGPGTKVLVTEVRWHLEFSSLGLWIGFFLIKIVAISFLVCFLLRKEHSKVTPGNTAAPALERTLAKRSA